MRSESTSAFGQPRLTKLTRGADMEAFYRRGGGAVSQFVRFVTADGSESMDTKLGLAGIGHVALKVADIGRSLEFYATGWVLPK